MSRARKCDRCGTLYEPKSIKLNDRQNGFNALLLVDMDMDNKYFTRYTKDLCHACLQELKNWLLMKEVLE